MRLAPAILLVLPVLPVQHCTYKVYAKNHATLVTILMVVEFVNSVMIHVQNAPEMLTTVQIV